ncbi:VF530 family protein [Aurantibacter sp.]|uniref:VF530 family protein n=1 Tax=Aurantibacter sp. TaxID=2807103 RepID=UPI003266AB01
MKNNINKQIKTPKQQLNNPLHGVKLLDILEFLTEKYEWEDLAGQVNIKCFKSNPSIKSSLKFLRKTPWAREKVEHLYLKSIDK